MNDSLIWLLVAGLLLLLLFLFYIKNRKKKLEIDFYNLFIIGIIWLVLAVPLKSYFYFIVGLGFIAIGFFNRHKWKKGRELSRKERMIAFIVGAILAVLLVMGIIAYFLL